MSWAGWGGGRVETLKRSEVEIHRDGLLGDSQIRDTYNIKTVGEVCTDTGTR